MPVKKMPSVATATATTPMPAPTVTHLNVAKKHKTTQDLVPYNADNIVKIIDDTLLVSDKTLKSVIKIWMSLKEAFLFGNIKGFQQKTVLERIQAFQQVVEITIGEFENRKVDNTMSQILVSFNMILSDVIVMMEAMRKIHSIKTSNQDTINRLLENGFDTNGIFNLLKNVLDSLEDQHKRIENNESTSDEELVRKVLQEMRKQKEGDSE